VIKLNKENLKILMALGTLLLAVGILLLILIDLSDRNGFWEPEIVAIANLISIRVFMSGLIMLFVGLEICES
jgi:hypothetical protein